ncbi:MAG TPA: hypothetical protein P5293_07465 [Bacteroidales bacterium]|nr:hypothetical protein [Bacteroidales bacterium]
MDRDDVMNTISISSTSISDSISIIRDYKINWTGGSTSTCSCTSTGWNYAINFPSIRDVLILVRNYVNRADTVDDFFQLSERINFICEILEADIKLTSEQIMSIFSLSYKEFQFLNKRKKEYRKILEKWSNKKKDIVLEDKLFEV